MGTSIKATLGKISSLVKLCRDVDGEMPMMSLQILTLIAAKPGINSQDIIKETGFTQSSVSRTLAILSNNAAFRKMGGYDFVKLAEDPNDRRNKVAYLTDKGKVFVSKLLNTIEPDQPVNMADLER